MFTTAFSNVLAAELPPGFHGGLNDLTGIGQLPPAIQELVKETITRGLRMGYYALTAFGGMSFLATLFIRHVPLSNMMQTRRENVDGGQVKEKDSVVEESLPPAIE